jgi:hypothetical protein
MRLRLFHEALELAPRQPGDVEQRPQRARREQRVTRAPQDGSRVRLLGAEPPKERRLADSCLASEQNQATATRVPHGAQPPRQRCEIVVSLEELRQALGCEQRRHTGTVRPNDRERVFSPRVRVRLRHVDERRRLTVLDGDADLAFRTATDVATVALLRDGEVLGERARAP